MKRLPLVKTKMKSPDKGSSLFEEQFMNERALMTIMKYLDDYDEPPGLDWPQQEIEEVTFTKWALEEILNLVWDHPWTPASETIEAFAVKLECYSLLTDREQQARIFSIAAKAAWETLDYIEEVEK